MKLLPYTEATGIPGTGVPAVFIRSEYTDVRQVR
jgi:hypothetical protein